MTIKLGKKAARFTGVCTIEEAESLLDWVQAHSQPRADLGDCEHLHTALLQILMAHRVSVTRLPPDPWLQHWLRPLHELDADSTTPSELDA